MFTKFALLPVLTKCKSFNDRATVWVDSYQCTTLRLFSYELQVCKVCINNQTQETEAFIKCDLFEDKYVNTQTTRKHVKDFLYQCFSLHFIEHFDEIMNEINRKNELVKIKSFKDFLTAIAEVTCYYKERKVVYTLTDTFGVKTKVEMEHKDK